MTTVRTSTYNLSGSRAIGDTVVAGDAGANFDSFGGSGIVTYEAAASGFSNPTTTVGRYVSTGVKIAGKKSIATWAAWACDGEFRIPSSPTGGNAFLLYASVGGTRLATMYMENGTGMIRIAGTTVQGLQAESVQALDGGTVVKYLWQGERASGLQTLVLFTDDYFEILEGVCGTTSGTLDVEEGVCTAAGSITVELNDTHLYDALQTLPAPEPGLLCGRNTGPRQDGWSIKVETSGYTDVRAKVYSAILVNGPSVAGADPFVITGDPLFTTDDVSVAASGWSEIVVEDCDPFTLYGAIVQGFDGADWVDLWPDEPWFAWTLPPDDEPYVGTLKVAEVGCEKDNKGDRTQVWDHICEVYVPHWITQTGDENYSNYQGLSAFMFRQFTSNKLRSTPGMQRAYRLFCQFWYQLSDHDCGDANGGFASAAIEFSTEAWLETSAAQALVVDLGGDLHEQGRVGKFLFGRWQALFSDFRTTARSDPEDAEGPLKIMFHADQEDWYLDALADHFANGGVTVAINDVPWVGEAEDQGEIGGPGEAKKDHPARYRTQRDRYDFVFAQVDVSGMHGDYHGGTATSRYASGSFDGFKHQGHMTWFCCNGTANDSGNVREIDEHNYEQWYAQESTTPDGTPIYLYTQMLLTDDGADQMIVQFNGIDANAGLTVMSMTDVFNPSGGEVVFPETREQLTIDEAPAREINGALRMRRMILGQMPAKIVSASQFSGLDGDLEGEQIDATSTNILLSWLLRNDSLEERRILTANLYALLGRKALREYAWAPADGFTPTWKTYARQDGSLTVIEAKPGQPLAEIIATPKVPSGRWWSTSTTIVEEMLNETGWGGTKEIIPLRHARAPMENGLVRVTGPIKFFNAEDGRTENGFHWGIPDQDPSLYPGERLIVDLLEHTAFVVDSDTWDTTGGVEQTQNLFHYGEGGSLLTLVPNMVGNDLTSWSVRWHVDCEGGVDGVTKIELMVAAATYEPYRVVV